MPLSTSSTRDVTTNLSVVTGLLSTVCRGSAKVTHDLLRTDISDAFESALCGRYERCVLDTMRFLDLLVVVLFEGEIFFHTRIIIGNHLRDMMMRCDIGEFKSTNISMISIITNKFF